MGNSDDITDQIKGRNDDYLLGIPRANLELKHMWCLERFGTICTI